MDYINIKVPATPAIESLVAALLQQNGVSASRDEPPPDFITLQEGAKIAGVTYSTFREWVIEQKRIPYSRPSGTGQGRIKVRRLDVENMLAGKILLGQRKSRGKSKRGVSIL